MRFNAVADLYRKPLLDRRTVHTRRRLTIMVDNRHAPAASVEHKATCAVDLTCSLVRDDGSDNAHRTIATHLN
jgi:hypothetical protein